MSWREGFDQAVLQWVQRRMEDGNDRYGHLGWGTAVEILDIEEKLDPGFGGSDVTPGDDPKVMLTVWWRNEKGDKHFVYEEMTLTELMKQLT